MYSACWKRIVEAVHSGLALLLLACTEAPAPEAGPGRVAGWPAWGGEPGGGHFSVADQITPANVHGLELAWVHNSGDIRQPTPFDPNDPGAEPPITRHGALLGI
jgi:glucose dehydrogenase